MRHTDDTVQLLPVGRCVSCAYRRWDYDSKRAFMAEVRFYAEAMFDGVISFMERWAPTQGVPPLSEIWKARQEICDPNSPGPSPTSPEDKDE